MYDLVRRFADHLKRASRDTYQALDRIFYEQLNIEDFKVDEATEEIACCPAGHPPQSSEHNNDTGKAKTVMPESACSQCEFRQQYPVKKIKGQYRLDHMATKSGALPGAGVSRTRMFSSENVIKRAVVLKAPTTA